MKNRKQYRVSMKDMSIGDDGKGKIVFATMNVIDKDGDYTEKGAFGTQLAHLLPMHVWKSADTPFLGVAGIREDGDQAVADIELNMDLQRAKDWRSSLKFALDRGKNIEWSYGFDVLKSEPRTIAGRKVRALQKMEVFEVSPVVIGAGEGTGTLDMKAYAELQGTWEAAQDAIRDAAQALLVGDQDGWCSIQGTYSDRVIVSVYIYGADETQSNTYQFDWSMGDDGTVALTNQRSVELSVVVTPKSYTLERNLARVQGEIFALTERYKALTTLRAKEGRLLSDNHKGNINGLKTRILANLAELDRLLAETSKGSGSASPNLAANLHAEFLRTQAQLAGHIGG